ncbi:inositol-pentakisphosphate 2-kinase [Wyeomyia smithii]|uniref:inositol-pentakisphosphate 2-kinase n=1 Tax=Wyeomyia smithii TaxID=174621 RepID=UPI00246820DD|nr:inositol-pentakisphosphate 2-kinase [Wyeomyia smithii]XP_055540013.1 inositol-pentakisphosphate 2-kinase [Wyeomyia smithii]XP_055540014.1 inositol-pentakisphosphate 2-kinase [Wyeomyia smithii]XP_055540015.1 inositol-pentakisphosphate 2-kinase [Wyeomyia smithii]XP_055540016.1 inositol-pentakisphosphate 2-kinase [Wyeomyia smithii]
MGKLNTNYGQHCYDGGTVINRAVTKYFRNCGTQNDSSDSCSERETGLRFGRIVCCRGSRSDSMTVERKPSNEAALAQEEILQRRTERAAVSHRDIGSSEEEDDSEGHAVVELIDESRLVYRAEGNANIVLSVADSCRVLRLRKSTIDSQSGKDSIVDLNRFVKYSQVVASLFSSQYVSEPRLGWLNTYDLEAFNKRLIKFRPVNRLEKEIHECDGILYPDVAFLPIKIDPVMLLQQVFEQDAKKHASPTYCVEIKPKQGWSFRDDGSCEDDFTRNVLFSSCDSTLAELAGPNVGKCRYCLYQYLKLQKKSIDKVSKYCPLDLFSGKPIRMLNAIKGLIGAPQNNFKLLKNGRIVYGEEQEKAVFNRMLKEIFQRDGRTKEERKTIFMNLMKEILLKDFTSYEALCDRKLLSIRKDRKKKDKNFIQHRTCSPINYQLLPKNCALKQILDIQLLVKSCLTKLNSKKVYENSADPFAYVDVLYEKHLDCLEDCRSSVGFSGKAESKRRANPDERLMNFTNFYLNEEEKYQLGATALDCSIMITFRSLSDREEDRLPPTARNHIISIEAMKFLVNVTITDLDPKSIHHHRKYLKQIQDSIRAYREFMSRTKR